MILLRTNLLLISYCIKYIKWTYIKPKLSITHCPLSIWLLPTISLSPASPSWSLYVWTQTTQCYPNMLPIFLVYSCYSATSMAYYFSHIPSIWIKCHFFVYIKLLERSILIHLFNIQLFLAEKKELKPKPASGLGKEAHKNPMRSW